MKHTFYILLLLLFTSACNWSKPTETSFEWGQSYTGGGGYIIGFLQSPHHDSLFYARCDVAGVFKSVDGGCTWHATNGDMTKWYHHYVRSIAMHPTADSVLFRCSGDYRNGTMFGSIHKSTNWGESWREVSTQAVFFGNGPTRHYGELIVGDPKSANIWIVADNEGSIFRSEDDGESWTHVQTFAENFTCVAIDTITNIYYAGTERGAIYSSKDKGLSWQTACQLKDAKLREIIVTYNQGGSTLYVATSDGIQRSLNNGKSFANCMNGLPKEHDYVALTVDPSNAQVMYCAPNVRPWHKLAPIPIYRTDNGGNSWSLIATHASDNIKNKPSYYTSIQKAGWAISKIRIDSHNPSRLLFSNWYGVCESQDGGKTFDAHDFKGLETCCLEHVAFNKASNNSVCFTLADHRPMISRDNGENYGQLEDGIYSSSTAIAYSSSDSTFILYGGHHRLSAGETDLTSVTAGILRVMDGKSELVWSKKGAYIQAIKEQPLQPGCYYAYIDGIVDDVAGIYQTLDYGTTWEKRANPFEAYVTSLPHNGAFIDNELLNIVVGQMKNVCGCNQLLETDALDPNTLYVGERSTGLYKSNDSGATWQNISLGLPFANDTASVLSVVKQDPTRGWLYAGFIREGLWRSKDGGKQWTKLYPTDQTLCNVTSLYVGGGERKEIVIGGENLYWSDAPISLLYSSDNGKSFAQIYDKSYGALRIKGVDMNPTNGRIFVVTSGNGAYYVDKKQQ